jgi:hypothetical protein
VSGWRHEGQANGLLSHVGAKQPATEVIEENRAEEKSGDARRAVLVFDWTCCALKTSYCSLRDDDLSEKEITETPPAANPEAPGAGPRPSTTQLLIPVRLELTTVNVILVDLDVSVPFLRQIVQGENCCHWTDRNTSTAVNALSRIDVQLRHFIERRSAIVIGSALCRMDTIHWADIHTGSVFGPDTGFGDDVGHVSPPCVGRISIRRGYASRSKSWFVSHADRLTSSVYAHSFRFAYLGGFLR